MIYKKDKLTIDGFNVEFLARKFNTPIYCYSLIKIKENILNLKLSAQDKKKSHFVTAVDF